jgi:TolA-binding protein
MNPPSFFDRRGSMASAGFDDFFGRRPSFGFDNLDLFGRRESMDSTTAAIDQAIMDLSRRRYSVAPSGLGGAPGDLGSTGNTFQNPASFSSFPSSGGGVGSSVHDSSNADTIAQVAQRQQQLQQQQRELEQRQKELEYQRQQLIASMQERSYGTMGGGGSGNILPGMQRSSMGIGGGGGSLGLGSVHSRGTVGGSSQSWWICQVCNSKAFASQEEAMAHEAVCGTAMAHSRAFMDPLPYSQDMMMNPSRFSMGFGSMDTSTRGMSLGLGGMDNSTRGVVSMGMDSSRGGGGSLGLDSSRNMSLGMDSSSGGHSYMERAHHMSMGPFAMLPQPMPLAMPSDKDWLTPLHCFVRRHCVEVFTASENDVATPSKGKRKPIQVGQVGIRCPHCHADDSKNGRERGSVYYPTTISSVYNATMNLLQRHLHSCPSVPKEIMDRYEALKGDDARSGTSKRYWIESAHSLGLVDTPNGIRHTALRPPPLPPARHPQDLLMGGGLDTMRRNSNDFFSSADSMTADMKEDMSMHSNRVGGGIGMECSTASAAAEQNNQTETSISMEKDKMASTLLVVPDDKPYSTSFSYHLLAQMQPCVFTEADRLGKRKGLPPGFPGLACRHCFGGFGSGRFFPSSIKTLSDTSKTLNVLHNHMMRCRKCPSEIKDNLDTLRASHDEERAKMKFGSQKAFFARIWDRLHGKDYQNANTGMKRPYSQPLSRNRGPPPSMHHMQQQQQMSNYHMMKQQHQQQQQMSRNNEYNRPIPMMQGHQEHPQETTGLDALAAASNPSKRQKLE